MLSSVSYVCLGTCAGMWVISRSIYILLYFIIFYFLGLANSAFGYFFVLFLFLFLV